MIACFVEENHHNWDRFLHEFSFALRTAVNETTGKTPTELFLDRKIITPFSKLVLVTDGAEYVGSNIEKLFYEAKQNIQRQYKTWEKYYNQKRKVVNIKVNDLVFVQTHFISAVGKRVVGKFMPKFEGPYRVLEVQNNNLTIWKRGRRVTNSENSRRSRKSSGKEIKSCKSDKGNAGLQDLRVKRDRAAESTGTSERYDGKRPKIYRKRSCRGSDYEQHGKRKAPVLPQGLKRGIPSSIYSRSHKYMRKDSNKHPSQEPEILPGTSNQGQARRSNLPKQKSSRKISVESDRTRESRPNTNREHSAAEGRPFRSRRKPTVRPLARII
ncbi:uncharacterized protein TNCV_3457791 [Trichonephila clavipes]|nr:uncharacterized protein TNCV_3457791 [Trichonephila clavipes]